MRGVAQFERNREIQPTRASPKNCRTHAPAPFALTDPACRRTRDITNIKYLDLKLFGLDLPDTAFPATSMTYGFDASDHREVARYFNATIFSRCRACASRPPACRLHRACSRHASA